MYDTLYLLGLTPTRMWWLCASVMLVWWAVTLSGAHLGAEPPEGTHGLAFRRNAGRTSCHHTLNDFVWLAVGRANVPEVVEPTDLLRSDGKRPDGLTQIPWQVGKCTTWDVTVTDTLTESYIQATSSSAGAAAEGAADRKEHKYQSLAHTHTFIHLEFYTLGPINSMGSVFLIHATGVFPVDFHHATQHL